MKKGKKKQDIVVIVNVKKLVLFLVTVALCVLALFCGFHTVKHFMKIGRFEVSGTSYYEPVDLINASGAKLGDRFYTLDTEEMEERLLRECPFLLRVEVKASFPNRLRIYAEERVVPWYVEVSGAKYALDRDLLVVDEIGETEGMARLILPSVRRVVGGAVPDFAESETELRRTLEAISIIRASDLFSRLSEIHLENRSDISVVVDGTFIVKLGNMDRLSHKLEEVAVLLKSDRMEGVVGGKIDASISGMISFAPSDPSDSAPQETE